MAENCLGKRFLQTAPKKSFFVFRNWFAKGFYFVVCVCMCAIIKETFAKPQLSVHQGLNLFGAECLKFILQ